VLEPACPQAPAETAAPPADSFPVVGIGASAGGLAAFEAFFSGMPADADPGMAFVLVQHLAPDHESLLSELVQRYTRMAVFEVQDGMAVRPNCVYIIPPNHDMAFISGSLQLLKPSAPRGQRLPIDFFFRSLADDQRERAIGIVLSGTGSDGTLSVRAIKAAGGMVMVQNPASAEYDGMPRSALATGLADYELPPAEMLAQLIAYTARSFGKLPRAANVMDAKTESALMKVFILLRSQTGHDFSNYKPGTTHRRIERRMAVQQIETLDGYVSYLRQTPSEVEALFRDMLIGVTNFFRDPEAFKSLEEQAIPALFAGKPASAVIRVWSAGCSTGEEAYSLAILLAERQADMKQSFKVQVFATDIDPQAIATARAGLYPAGIAADLSPERLARFFKPEPGGGMYRIHKGIRDMLVFSEQDVIKDPPFSQLDLVSCRNLMIYLNGELQKRLLPLFHRALKPGGFLFLGTSEGVGEFGELFAPLERKSRLYRRSEPARGLERAALPCYQPPVTALEASLPRAAARPAFPAARQPLRERAEQALLQAAPAGALVNAQGDIFHLHGRTGMYLEPAPGDSDNFNILKMAREGLRNALAVALHKAASGQGNVSVPGLSVKTNSHFTAVNLTVRPLAAGAAEADATPLYLVTLEDAPRESVGSRQSAVGSEQPAAGGGEDGAKVAALERELLAKDEYIKTTHEQLAASTEELKSSNEEMQSVNEELQSTNEELETAKEELQSVNEELVTVNAELQAKVADLSQANGDMGNLLAGTCIGTVFVDQRLRILRFTSDVSPMINLTLSDVGRPISHFVVNLTGYDRLVKDLQSVLDTLIPVEREVLATEGKWYKMRVHPYRTTLHMIEGAVVTFVDITEMVQTREALRKANELLRLAVVVRDSRDAVTVLELNGRVIAWNPAAVRLYGWSEAEALAMNALDHVPQELRAGVLDQIQQLGSSEILEPFRTWRLTKAGVPLEVWMTATALVNETGQMYAVATTERAYVGGGT
jgi:two-component system CheB/CheR fusion protein